MSYAVIAFIIGAIFFITEIFTLSFFMFFFGIGTWAAALYLAFYDSLSVALGIFCLTSVLTLVLLRSTLVKTFHGAVKDSKNKMPEFIHIGKHALVSVNIPAHNFGEIELAGSFWRATAENNIPKGKEVIVLGQVENDEISLIVKEIE